LGKVGRMLVGSIIESGGSPPGLMIDMAMKAFSALAVRSLPRSNVPRIGM